jgi:hypothetical protein
MGIWSDMRGREDARMWLARHRLPADDATVALVARRLRARRRGVWLDMLVYTGVVVVGWWALAHDQLWEGPDLTVWLAVVVTGSVAGDVVRRWVMWSRWDRRQLAEQQVRVASLRRPSWDDLVGTRFVRRAAVLVGVVLLLAVEGYRQTGAAEAAVMVFIVLAAPVHVGLLLEVARRRALPAGNEVALAVNDRLRGEEANHAATDGLVWVVLAPVVVWNSNLALPLIVFVGYLYTVHVIRHRYAYELAADGHLVAR